MDGGVWREITGLLDWAKWAVHSPMCLSLGLARGEWLLRVFCLRLIRRTIWTLPFFGDLLHCRLLIGKQGHQEC